MKSLNLKLYDQLKRFSFRVPGFEVRLILLDQQNITITNGVLERIQVNEFFTICIDRHLGCATFLPLSQIQESKIKECSLVKQDVNSNTKRAILIINLYMDKVVLKDIQYIVRTEGSCSIPVLYQNMPYINEWRGYLPAS